MTNIKIYTVVTWESVTNLSGSFMTPLLNTKIVNNIRKMVKLLNQIK